MAEWTWRIQGDQDGLGINYKIYSNPRIINWQWNFLVQKKHSFKREFDKKLQDIGLSILALVLGKFKYTLSILLDCTFLKMFCIIMSVLIKIEILVAVVILPWSYSRWIHFIWGNCSLLSNLWKNWLLCSRKKSNYSNEPK